MSFKYTKEHEWVKMTGAGEASVGISNHAQEALGDITFVELPKVGAEYAAGDVFAVVESVKAASDIYMPVAGKILEINSALESEPQLVNSSPLADGWLVKIAPSNAEDIASLMDESAYLAGL